MKLRVSRLDEGENRFSFESGKAEWLHKMVENARTQGDSVREPFTVELALTKSEPDYYLQGQMRFSIDCDCSRCAEGFNLPVEHRFAMALARTTSKPAVESANEDESEELDVTFFEGDEIDLKPIVQEQLVLSLPYNALCSANCRGICQHCGINRNTSNCACAVTNPISPFAALAQLKTSHPRS